MSLKLVAVIDSITSCLISGSTFVVLFVVPYLKVSFCKLRDSGFAYDSLRSRDIVTDLV